MNKKETPREKKELLKKVGKYSVAAGAALLTGNMANAAIQSAISGVPFNIDYNYYGIDFDGDGQFEAIIAGAYDSYLGVTYNFALIAQGSDPDPDAQYFEILQGGSFGCNNNDPAALPGSFNISASASGVSWANGYRANLMVTYSGYNFCYGNFVSYPNETRYVGVRFSADGTNWHYGWIAIQANPIPYSSGNFGQVLNYAYETTENTPILAGVAGVPVPLLPIASAAGLGLIGLFGAVRARRRKKQTV